MDNRTRIFAMIMFAVATLGIGCGSMDIATVEESAETLDEISDLAADTAPLAPPPVANHLRLVQIITQSLSAIAYAFLGWRLKQDSNKEK